MHFLRSIAAVVGLTLPDLFRRNAFRFACLFFLVAAFLGAIPFSPGVEADPEHYRDAGLSTLYLGGLFLAFVCAPLLLAGSRGRDISSALLRLPLARIGWIFGIFAGFALSMVLFFSLGAVLLMIPGLLGWAHPDPWIVASRACESCLASLMVFSLILFFSQVFPYAIAIVAACVIIALGYLSPYLPLPLGVLLPAFYCCDPLANYDLSINFNVAKAIHVFSLICIGLALASRCIRKTGKRPGFML